MVNTMNNIQERIEVGQDINNTWALIGAEQSTHQAIGDKYLLDRFQKLFSPVQEANAWARQQRSLPAHTTIPAVVPTVADFMSGMTNEQVLAQLNLERISREAARKVKA